MSGNPNLSKNIINEMVRYVRQTGENILNNK